MNFKSSQGFYEKDQNQMIDGGKLPFYCNSSSSAESQSHKNLVPLTFHQQQRGSSSNNSSWFENHRRSSSAAADEISSSSTIRYYNSTGGAASNLELMDLSPCFRNNRDDAAEDHEGGGGTSSTSGGGVVGLVVEVEREHMFDKVVTPSDVGKLNRLVIPKQHAEKYFPLDSSTNDKGLLLNFEDRTGKPWRFRYSYWNSSQSYVMTKGWSRFVKEKKLDAGDIVSFQRGLGELGKDRLFIDWRRRPEIPPQGLIVHPPSPLPQHYLSFQRMSNTQPQPWSSSTATPLFLQSQPPIRDYSHFHHHNHHPNSSAYNQPHFFPSSSYGYGYGSVGGPYPTYNTNSTSHPYSSSLIYLRSSEGAQVAPSQGPAGMVQLQSSSGSGGSMDIGSGVGIGAMPMVLESVPVVQGKAAAKRLRLFGVNMDCPISESDECEILPSTTTTMPDAATMATWPPHPPPNIHPLQLRLYNGSPFPTMHPDKGNAPHKSFDLDI